MMPLQYYTTDPFFAKDMAGSSRRRSNGHGGNVAGRRSSMSPSTSPLPREKIPAPLLARSEKPPTAPTRPRKVGTETLVVCVQCGVSPHS